MTPADLSAQIQCVEREIRLRHRVYPRLVQQGKLTPAQAQHELLTMASVLRPLRDLARAPQQQEELPYAPTP